MLAPLVILMPIDICSDRGQTPSATLWLAQQGSLILLVHGVSPRRTVFPHRQLEALQLEVTAPAVSHEPWFIDIKQGAQLAHEKGVQAVVNPGGDAVIDTDRTITALVPIAGLLADYLEMVGTGRQLEASPLPFVAIPTTAGIDAEITKNAVINVPEQQRKVNLYDNRMLPDLTVVNPAPIDSTPRNITLDSSPDTLTQVIEPQFCSRATPFTGALYQQAIPRGIRALKILMEREYPVNRNEVAWVGLCGELALANAELGVIHGLTNPLGDLSHISHGVLCGSLLPLGLALNESRIGDPTPHQCFNDTHRRLVGGLDTPMDWVQDSLREWSHHADLNTLRDLGVMCDAPEPAVLAASTSSSMKANPANLSDEQLLGMLEVARE